MNKCEKCGFLHYRTDPCRVAKKSGASVALASNDRVHDPAAIHLTVQPKASVAAGRVGQKSTGGERSGAQAASGWPKIIPFDGMGAVSDKPPVDTNGNEKDHRDHSGQGLGTGRNASAGAIPASSAAKFDKKAWQREYMRGYMQRLRAKAKNG